MSEFTNTSELRANELAEYMFGLLRGENGSELIEKHEIKTNKFIPHDILNAFDILIEKNVPVEDIKFVSNKLFNILYQTLLEYPTLDLNENPFTALMVEDNKLITNKLKDTKEFIKKINASVEPGLLNELIARFEEIEKYILHYTVIENVVFPKLESEWKHHLCVKVMWSFHDDIRRNIAKMIALLKSDEFDLKAFNTLSGLIFFNISTIVLREEKIIFPVMLETMPAEMLENMLDEAVEIGLPYAQTEHKANKTQPAFASEDKIYLPTGALTAEEFNMIFNHMPVDITYVDENDTVRFYSNPPHRIFPRTPAIIGRKVQNCHPPESVHVVNRIVESFKTGEKDVATFWFHMGPRLIMIQYFAVRDAEKIYKGVLEVSQEITEIQKLEGDRKLLDW